MFYILKMPESLRKKVFQLKVNCSLAIAITSFVFKKKTPLFKNMYSLATSLGTLVELLINWNIKSVWIGNRCDLKDFNFTNVGQTKESLETVSVCVFMGQ